MKTRGHKGCCFDRSIGTGRRVGLSGNSVRATDAMITQHVFHGDASVRAQEPQQRPINLDNGSCTRAIVTENR